MFSSDSSLCYLYFALVRSTLECDGIVWYPYLATNQLKIERLQNNFLSYISFILKIEHPQQFNMTTLLFASLLISPLYLPVAVKLIAGLLPPF